MLFKRYILLAAAAIAPISALSNNGQAIPDIQALAAKTQIAKRDLDSYDGGIASGLRVFKSIYGAHQALRKAGDTLDNSDPFEGEDGEETLRLWNEFHPLVVETLRSGEAKAPLVKKAGMSYVAQGMLSNLYNEKRAFEDSMRRKLSSNHSRMVQPAVDDIDQAYDSIMQSYRS